MYGDKAAEIFLKSVKSGTVLDIGAGRERAFAELCRKAGIAYVPFDYAQGFDWETLDTSEKFDGIWMSHVLEHFLEPHAALVKAFNALRPDGVLAVTVPPLKHEIVGGHISLWNAGLLLYRLILAGFDCSEAAVKTYGYNVSVVVRKKRALLPRLVRDNGDIELLEKFFPFPAKHGFDGRIRELNWGAV